jgi:hypothetical protein
MRHGCDLRGFLGSTFKPFQDPANEAGSTRSFSLNLNLQEAIGDVLAVVLH